MGLLHKYQVCIHCRVPKILDDYYKHPMMKNGHLGKCKECCKIGTKSNYRKNINHYVEYDHNRQLISKRRLNKLEYQRKRRKNNPEKYKANNAVKNALKNGKLKKQPCELCGNPTAQAHHDDYSKPLDVKWRCFSCHLHIHGKVKR